MEMKTSIGKNLLLLVVLCVGLMAVGVTGRPQSHRHHHHHAHRQYDSRHHHHHQNSHANNDPTNTNNNDETVAGKMSGRGKSSWRHTTDDDYDYDEESDRHAYLMTPNNVQAEVKDEDDAITSAFEKHMRPNHHTHHGSSSTNTKTSQPPPPEHDVYAYQLPSSLWFIVRYAKDPDGHVEKYMNIVDSFSNYLEKLEKVRTVSVNDLKGVETVFRLTPQHKPFHLH